MAIKSYWHDYCDSRVGLFPANYGFCNGTLKMVLSRQNLLFPGLLKDILFWFSVLDRNIKFNGL